MRVLNLDEMDAVAGGTFCFKPIKICKPKAPKVKTPCKPKKGCGTAKRSGTGTGGGCPPAEPPVN